MSDLLFHPVHALAYANQRRDELAADRKRAGFVHTNRRPRQADRAADAYRASLAVDPRDAAILAATR